MRPAVVALGMALFLFLLVQGIRPPLLYAVLLVPVFILIYGFITKELPETKFDDEDARERKNEEDDAGNRPGDGGSDGK